jgi:prophage regulatory protein
MELEEQSSMHSSGSQRRPATGIRGKTPPKVKKNTADHLKKECYLTVKEVAHRYGVCRQTLWRWEKNKKFPPRVKLSATTARWRLSDLIAFEATLSGGLPKAERPPARHLLSKRENQT